MVRGSTTRSRPGARRLLVTGGAGLLGRHVVAAAVDAGWEVSAPSSSAMDVRDAAAVERAMRHVAPTAIAHLAYRRGETDTIVEGTANVAAAAARCGARLVHLSTDVVFAGRDAPYTEDDPPDPVIDYGRAKATAERTVAERCPDAVVVRTSLLYAGDGSAPCERDVLDVLDGRSAMAFFTDEVRCPTHVADVAAAVVALAGRRDVTGPLHVAAAEGLDRASFARRVAAAHGRDPAAVPTATIAAAGLVRPARIVLDVTRSRALGLVCRPVDAALAGPVRRRTS